MKRGAASIHREGPYSAESAVAVAAEIRAAMGGPSTLAFAFCSGDYAPHVWELCDILRVDGHVIDVAGCFAPGWIESGSEHERRPGMSVLALALPGVGGHVLRFGAGSWPAPAPASGWIALAGSHGFDIEAWLSGWSPDRQPVVGGIAAGPAGGDGRGVFHNGEMVDALAVSVAAPSRLVPVVTQGCRPIGDPLTVTKAESNVIFSMGSRPAYEALEMAFESLSDKEKSTARGNLFAGLAGTEYVDDFHTSDFLVRNIIGADPHSGAVAIGGIPRIGQTVQYQLRDAVAASSDLDLALRRVAADFGVPAASLLFSCAERGQAFFGIPSHDASAAQRLLGRHPSAGFSCAGEIGPVAERNCVHFYSLACAAIYAPPHT